MTRANSLTKAIIQFLNLNGHCAMRNNTVGIWDVCKKIYRRNQDRSAIGSGDILCCLKGGKWLEIEIKVGGDKPSMAQLMRSQKIMELGGFHWFITNWETFEQGYDLLVRQNIIT
jgi:hypothetical protein